MTELITITLALFFALLGGEIAKKLKYPRIIGQLAISLVFAFPIFKAQFATGSSGEIVTILSELGAILLLFLTGFDIDIKKLKTVKKEAILIAIFAAIIPFGLGSILGLLIGFDLYASLVLGAAMSVTAEGTKVALLIELKKVNSRIGSIMLGAGIVDDVFEILFLTIILIYSHQSGSTEVSFLPIKIGLFALAIVIGNLFIPKVIHYIEREKDMISLLTFMLLIALAFAVGADKTGLSGILGAFIGGILAQQSFMNKGDVNKENNLLKALAFGLLIPFFFINIGLNFSFSSLIENPFLTLFVVAVAIIGKLGGTLLTKPFHKLTWKQLILIGWGMNSRGVMELVIAQIAFTAGLITEDLYSAIIFMSIVTTILFPVVIQHMIKRDSKIMD